MPDEFGPYLRELRKARGIPLRRFADAIGMDPSNYSRVERGEAPPPQTPIMSAIIEQLGLEAGRDPRWYQLLSCASVSRGRVPDPVLQDEEIARLLPAFFARVHQLRDEHPATLDELRAAFRAVIERTQERPGAQDADAAAGANGPHARAPRAGA